MPGLAPDRQWHRIDGIWYEVELRPLPSTAIVFDVVLKRHVRATDRRHRT